MENSFTPVPESVFINVYQDTVNWGAYVTHNQLHLTIEEAKKNARDRGNLKFLFTLEIPGIRHIW